MVGGGQVILDAPVAGRVDVFAEPIRVIVAHEPDAVPDAFAAMQCALAAGHYLAGYFSYELGYVLEPYVASLLPPTRRVPLLWFGEFAAAPASRTLDAACGGSLPCRAYATPLTFAWDVAAYRNRFAAVMAAIGRGDVYEVNLSFRARFRVIGNPLALYHQLRAGAGVGYGAFVDAGEHQILSLSPEMFFSVDPDGTVTARPMKGTAPRATDAAADRASREALRTSAKNRAENLMIVDLLRNDLGRIATPGSVAVPELFRVEAYPTVYQMTSTIRAAVRPGVGIAELLHALYPCGSITGAPKIRAMQLIRGLEDSPRGAYCGAIGVFAPDGSARFNVAIRTLTVAGGRGELGIGGAVVSDSGADDEYAECRLKARFFERGRRPLTLIETLAYRHGTWPRRARHLQRMARSARVFGLPFDPLRAAATLDAAVPAGGAQAYKVRLRLREDGQFDVDVEMLPPLVASLRFVVSAHRVLSSDVFNRHKTGWREPYAEALAAARAQGADEAILVNERGEVSEGTYTNVFIERAGRLVTPPLASGALPGCLREELLDSDRCSEAVLTVRDLARAEHVFLGNSLRGLIEGVPLASPRVGVEATAGADER